MSVLGSQRAARASLAQSHRLKPTLESVRLFYRCITLPEVLHPIRSFPLLDDLQLCSLAAGRNIEGWNTPTSPKLTRTLGLVGKVSSIARGLLDLPGILHFAKIKVWCPNYDAESVKGLVSKCSGTLESLCIDHDLLMDAFRLASVVDKYPTAIRGPRYARHSTSTGPFQGHKTQICEISV